MGQETLVQSLSDTLSGNRVAQAKVADIMKQFAGDPNALADALSIVQTQKAPDAIAKNRAVADALEFGSVDRAALSKIPQNKVSAKAFWWGYQVYFPERVMKDLAVAGNIASAVGGFLAAAAATCPPIAPFVGIIAAYVALEFVLLQSIDGGHGVMLSATWVSPGILVPTRLNPG